MNHDFIRFQADHHPLIETERFESVEEYCLHLIHLKAYQEAALLAKERNVLDLGCNNGWGTELLSRAARRVVGADVSETALAVARESVTGTNVEFTAVNGERLPFSSGEFELVVS